MGLFPKNLNEFVAGMGIPRGPLSKVFFVDTVNGSTSNSGTSWQSPLKTLEAAYALCTADRHDAVLFLSGDTADNPAAAITWGKDYTHLIGLSSNVYGLGQRCRVVALAATAISPVITFSSNGCIVKNMQFNQEKATGSASGVAIVTGSRNYFENVFFMAPTSATAASYSLKMNGSENVFYHCTTGQYTNFRSEATYGLWLHGATAVSRNKFVKSEFLSWNSATHVHVLVDSDIVTVPWVTVFEDCFFGGNHGGGTILTQAIDDNSTAVGHQILLRGHNDFVGCTAVADTTTYLFTAEQGTGTQSGLLMAAVNES
jgi:hypothetical protein